MLPTIFQEFRECVVYFTFIYFTFIYFTFLCEVFLGFIFVFLGFTCVFLGFTCINLGFNKPQCFVLGQNPIIGIHKNVTL